MREIICTACGKLVSALELESFGMIEALHQACFLGMGASEVKATAAVQDSISLYADLKAVKE